MIAPALPHGSNGSLPEAVTTQADPLEYVSVSRLKSFLSCRLRFYFEKVLALPKPVSPALHFGKAIHAALQAYNKARWRGGDTSENAILTAFQSAFAKPEGEVAWSDASEPLELRTKGDTLLRAFLGSGVHQATERPMGVEVAVHADIPALALPLFGILDLVDAGRRVTDYKTVASTPDLALEAWLHETQTTAYGLLVEYTTEAPAVGTDLVFLVKTKAPKILVHSVPPPSPVQRQRFTQLVEVYANAVANEHYFPQPGQHCSWCPYREECSAWKGGTP
ncbi:MAG: PD-(D/E)XK nuclease family protein [Verrucomicrobia bacterium]|nr:PD-(D/E)XK nuclease family protein [Verrucomicrobiota bacterium]